MAAVARKDCWPIGWPVVAACSLAWHLDSAPDSERDSRAQRGSQVVGRGSPGSHTGSDIGAHTAAVVPVEPVGNELNAENVAEKLAHKRVPLKAALLDQRVIAGLGNIYVCEALWRSKLAPKREARTLVMKSGKPTKRLEILVDHIRDVIGEAIEAGGSSLRDHAQTDGTLGYFQHTFAAYDREGEPCRHEGCGKAINRIVQSGRSTFYCPSCQR